MLENRKFADAAAAILAACRTILAAQAGFVAVRLAGRKGLVVACVAPDDLELAADGCLPPTLRRLCSRAATAGRAVITDVVRTRSPQVGVVEGPSALSNAPVAPVTIAGDAAGFVGLLNAAGGFSAADARLAEVFAEMTAMALHRSRAAYSREQSRQALESEVLESTSQLRQSEEQFRNLVDSLPDIIARFDSELRHLYVSPAVEWVTGRPPGDFIGRTNQELGMPPELVAQWDGLLHRAFATGLPARHEFTYPAADGTRYFDCRLVPELDPDGSVRSVLSVARDVTDRWLAYESERHARSVADALREATVALTRSLDRETVLATLLERLRLMVPFDRATVMLVEDASRVSVRTVFDGERVVPVGPEARAEFDPSDHPVVHAILTSGTAVLIPDLHARPDWSLPTDGGSEASWMGVPLFARGDVAGLFSLSKREADYFNEEHMRLAEAMASQASVAVENAVLYEQMRTSTARMRSLSRRLVDVQESERRHIARELHDEAGQALASLRIGLRLLEREAGEGGSVSSRVADLVQRTDAVIDGLHRLAADLRPASLDHLGLEAALRQLTRSIGPKLGLAVRFKSRGLTAERLPPEVESSLYRVVQEAMTNVARHADATWVDVLVDQQSDHVTVMVEDDGVGFAPDRVKVGEHFGLLGLRERADAMGGTLTVESAPGKGTTIVVEVPIAMSHPDR